MRLPKRPRMIAEAAASGGLKWYLEILIFLPVFFVPALVQGIVQIVCEVILTAAAGRGRGPEIAEWYLIISLFLTAVTTAAVILFCKFFQHRSPRTLGFCGPRPALEYLVGCLVGAALFGGAVLLCVLTGSLTLSPQRFPMGMWLFYLVGFLIQGMSEEVLCRGYFMVSLARRNHLALAVFLNSLVFSLLHLGNNGVTPLALFNVLLFGLFASLYVLRRGSLWGACAMHSVWNFLQGNVFGISVSGNVTRVSPLTATRTAGHWIWHGGAFGAEGGLAVTWVLLVGILLALFLMKDRPDREPPVDASARPDPAPTVGTSAPQGYDPFSAPESEPEKEKNDENGSV